MSVLSRIQDVIHEGVAILNAAGTGRSPEGDVIAVTAARDGET